MMTKASTTIQLSLENDGARRRFTCTMAGVISEIPSHPAVPDCTSSAVKVGGLINPAKDEGLS